MKQVLSYIMGLIVVAALGWMPFRKTDVAKLQPVEVVRVTLEGREVVIETDTEAAGRGKSLKAAFEDMKQTTAGEVFLDTADYLILSRDTVSLLPELMEYLRPACQVCIGKGEMDLGQAAAFLTAHEPELTLTDWQGGLGPLPVLVEDGGMRIVKR